jgi:hypothetical protein
MGHRLRGRGLRHAGLRPVRHHRPRRHRCRNVQGSWPHLHQGDRGHQLRLPAQRTARHLTLTGENFRINSYSYPQLSYDDQTGLLALTWSDDRNGTYDSSTGASIKSNGDNIVALSADGRRWTPPTVIGTPQDEVFGAIAIQDGIVARTSYTRHYDPSGVNLDYAYWTTKDLRSRSLAHSTPGDNPVLRSRSPVRQHGRQGQ